MEQLHYNIYRITNTVDDKIYIGSTRCTLAQRMTGHRDNARSGCPKDIAAHMRAVGIDNCKIELIETIVVPTRVEARKREQEEIDKIPQEQRLNMVRAYSENHDRTRDINKKRANRRDFYNTHKQNPEWLEKERARNRERMRIKRAAARNK